MALENASVTLRWFLLEVLGILLPLTIIIIFKKNEKTVLNSAAFYTYFIIIHLPKETKDNIKFNLHRYYCYYY